MGKYKKITLFMSCLWISLDLSIFRSKTCFFVSVSLLSEVDDNGLEISFNSDDSSSMFNKILLSKI